METPIIHLDSIDAYNKLYGLKTLHPLVTVIDLKDAVKTVNHIRMDYGVYALFLKNNTACSIKYGRRKYDYQEGTIVSFAPGQLIDVETDRDELAPDVVGILFHPDLIYGTSLGERIKDFGFFEYSQLEAVHLSEDERGLFLSCLENIKTELTHGVDQHSSTVISAGILFLLEYVNRFYDRQFITRHKVNSDIVTKFERELKEYLAPPTVSGGIPSVAYFADKLNLTPGYFGDLIKKETGTSPKDLIALRIVEEAKHRLTASSDSVSEIAYSLGFDYPAHFSRMFKRISGQTPIEYRSSAN